MGLGVDIIVCFLTAALVCGSRGRSGGIVASLVGRRADGPLMFDLIGCGDKDSVETAGAAGGGGGAGGAGNSAARALCVRLPAQVGIKECQRCPGHNTDRHA